MRFDKEMAQFCEHRFKVARRVERLIDERTGKDAGDEIAMHRARWGCVFLRLQRATALLPAADLSATFARSGCVARNEWRAGALTCVLQYR